MIIFLMVSNTNLQPNMVANTDGSSKPSLDVTDQNDKSESADDVFAIDE